MPHRRVALLAGLLCALSPAAAAQAPTQPPIRPVMPDLPVLDPAACADPARRASILADGERILDLARAHAQADIAYSINLLLWRNARLRRSSRWTDVQEEAFTARLSENPEILRWSEAGETAASESLPDLQPIAAGKGADQQAADCRLLASLRDYAIRIAPIHEAQWRAIEAAYAAEARRLGVSLD
jgi:hypothetical protein